MLPTKGPASDAEFGVRAVCGVFAVDVGVRLAAVAEAVLVVTKVHPTTIDAMTIIRTEAASNFLIILLTSFIACFTTGRETKRLRWLKASVLPVGPLAAIKALL